MSHFSSVTTRLTNKDQLINSIKSIGAPVEQCLTNHAVRGYQGRAVEADIVAVLDGSYDLGFKLVNGQYIAVGDFSMGSCGGGDQRLAEVLNQIVARYKTEDTLAAANNQRGLENARINVSVR